MLISGVRSLRRALAGAVLTVCLAVAVVVVAAGCGGSVGAGAQPTATSSDRGTVTARVDGVPVTQADVDAIVAEARLEGRQLDRSKALEQAVRRVLVQRAAARAGLTVDDAAVQAGISALSERTGGEAELSSSLIAAGLSRERLRAALAAGLLEARLADRLFPDLRAGSAASRSFYRRKVNALFTTAAKVRLAKITLPGEKIADKVAARLAAGAPFGPTAQRFSMDPETRSQGGLLGWVLVVTLPPEVRAALAGVHAGGVTEPVRSSGRWQLFKLYARRPARVTPFADVAGLIRRELTRRRRAAALDEWLAKAAKRAQVEILQ
jgi:parvulin-like peptidyl-prolyl isomerase